MDIPEVKIRSQETGASFVSPPYVKIAAAAFAVFALGSVVLGLHYAHTHAFLLKNIEDLPTSTLLEVDIPVMALFGVAGVDRTVISIRYHHWSEENLLREPYEEQECFKESEMRFTVLTSERGPTSPRGIFEVAYHQLQAVAGSLVSLARLRSIDEKRFEEKRKEFLEKEGYEVKGVALERDGISYQGFLVTKNGSALNQDRWAIQAVGVTGYAQKRIFSMGKAYGERGFNLLIVNPPGVGKSEGKTTGKTLGQAQETGVRFLEHIGAKKIILAGFSMGGGMMGSAIMQHRFRDDIAYLGLFQMTFSTLSKAAAGLIHGGIKGFSRMIPLGPIPSYLGGAIVGLGVRSLGMEMDSVSAVQKLTESNIPVIVVQKSTQRSGWTQFKDVEFASDWIISKKASLGSGLQKDLKVNRHLIFSYNPRTQDLFLPHNTPAERIIAHPLQTAIEILPQATHSAFFV